MWAVLAQCSKRLCLDALASIGKHLRMRQHGVVK